MRRTIGAAVLILGLIAGLVATIVLAAGARSDARAALADRSRARSELLEARRSLDSARQTIGALQAQVESRDEAIGGLHGQVEWDKSHLLDCWTAIVRALPVESIPAVDRRSMWAARTGDGLDHYVHNCATDAVP